MDSGFLDNGLKELKTLLDDCRQTLVNISETRISLDSLNCRLNTESLITKHMGLNVVDVRIIMMMLVS